MEFLKHLPEIGGLDSGVDLSGLETGVTEQLLDVADVGSVLKHVGSASVPNGMEAHVLLDVQFPGQLLEKIEKRVSGHGTAATGEKESVCSVLLELRAPQLEILMNGSGCFFSHRDKALAATLAVDQNETFLNPKCVESQALYLGSPHAGCIEKFQGRSVSERGWLRAFDRGQDLEHLLHGEDVAGK